MDGLSGSGSDFWVSDALIEVTAFADPTENGRSILSGYNRHCSEAPITKMILVSNSPANRVP